MKKDLQIDYGGKDNKAIYTARGNKRSFCLTGSEYDDWKQNNVEFIRVEDDGNGLKLYLCDLPEPIELNYLQAEWIRLALKIADPRPTLAEIIVRPFTGLKHE